MSSDLNTAEQMNSRVCAIILLVGGLITIPAEYKDNI